MHEVSPELALVDPDLGARLRASLPGPPDCLEPRARPVPALQASIPAAFPPALPPAPPTATRAASRPAPPPRRFERVVATALWTPIVAVVASSLLAFISTGSSLPRLEGQSVDPPRSSTAAPRAQGSKVAGAGGANATTKAGAKRAAGSDATAGEAAEATGAAAAPRAPAPKPEKVILRWQPVAEAEFYDVVVVAGGKRTDYWPARNRIALRRGAPSSRVTVEWYVYPAYRVGGVVRFGKLHAQGRTTASVE